MEQRTRGAASRGRGWKGRLADSSWSLLGSLAAVLVLGAPQARSWSADSSAFAEFCWGDGSGVNCPCQNNSGPGEGCANSTGMGARLDATGTAEIGNDTVKLYVQNSPAFAPGIFFSGPAVGQPNHFGNGLYCLRGETLRLEIVAADANGYAVSSVVLSEVQGLVAGERGYYQYWYRDVIGPCSAAYNFSNGCVVLWE